MFTRKARVASRSRHSHRAMLEPLEARQLLTAAIDNTTLVGSWFYSGMNLGSKITFTTDQQTHVTTMTVGTIDFEVDVNDGPVIKATSSLVDLTGATVNPTGVFTVNANGTLSMTFSNTTYTGSFNATRDVVTFTKPGITETVGVLVKRNNTVFANTDLSGTWSVFENSNDANTTGSGTFNFDGKGHITGGSVKSASGTLNILGGAYSFDATGVIGVTYYGFGPNGSEVRNYYGQLNPTKDVVAMHASDIQEADGDNQPIIATWIKNAATIPLPTLAGAWTVSGDGLGGTVNVDAAGNITSGSITDATNTTFNTVTGKLTVKNTVLTLTLTLTSGNTTKTITETGALNASRNLAVLQKAPSADPAKNSKDSTLFMAQVANRAPTLTTIANFSTAVEQTPFTITYAQLLAASNAFDPDNDTIKFYIESINGAAGTLTINNGVITPGHNPQSSTLLSPGDFLTWTPVAGAGTAAAFTVRITDGDNITTNDVTINIKKILRPTVSIVSTKKVGYELQTKPKNFVTFKVSRSGGDMKQPLTVKFTTSGTLPIDGSGFTSDSAIANPGSVTIPANKSFIVITLIPKDNDDADAGGKRELTLTLAPGANTSAVTSYAITSTTAKQSAKITIMDHNEPPTLNITSPLAGAFVNLPFDISYNALKTAVGASDREGEDLTFKVRAITGTTKKNTIPTIGLLTITSNDTLTWTPPHNARGIITALRVQVIDPNGSSKFATLKIIVTP